MRVDWLRHLARHVRLKIDDSLPGTMQSSSQNHSMVRSPYRGLFKCDGRNGANAEAYLRRQLAGRHSRSAGFDRAGSHPTKAVREGSAFGKPSGAESYFIVVTNREHHLTLTMAGLRIDGPAARSRALHPTQIMRTLTEPDNFVQTIAKLEPKCVARLPRVFEYRGKIFPMYAEFLRPLNVSDFLSNNSAWPCSADSAPPIRATAFPQ